MSRNNFPGCSFLKRGARRTANVSFVGNLVSRMNRVARVVGVEEVGTKLADSSETIFDHPVSPVAAVFAMTSFGPRPPNCVSKHCAERSAVRQNVGLSADKMVEVGGGRGNKMQLVVDVGDRSKHRRLHSNATMEQGAGRLGPMKRTRTKRGP